MHSGTVAITLFLDIKYWFKDDIIPRKQMEAHRARA